MGSIGFEEEACALFRCCRSGEVDFRLYLIQLLLTAYNTLAIVGFASHGQHVFILIAAECFNQTLSPIKRVHV